MSGKVWFDPTSDKWALSDGEHYLEVPHWAREIIADEFERETGQLKADNAKLRELVKARHGVTGILIGLAGIATYVTNATTTWRGCERTAC